MSYQYGDGVFDARANNALYLLQVLVLSCLGLCFSLSESTRGGRHWSGATRSTSGNASQALGLEVVPHLLFPDSKI